ncbi:uncharacterized protein A4U43_C10F3100 [Asparagus officinalis]|uniref:Uncharacterized protein n=1 Tax=Asparagus officinalis TaxID=4686 RepID=A0A5P1E0R4_ASPOF|nr:uncharacterized protein A4U43_C10F3100 [Asparagus officinalis]
MGQRHLEAYEDSVFRLYIHFSHHGLDLPTFEYMLRQWDEKKIKFTFTDTKTGEDIESSFNLDWILYQVSMIWYPISVPSTPMYLFKYVDSIEQANNTTWETYIFSTPHIVADIEIEREVPQPDFTDINKKSEGPLPGEVPPTANFPPADSTDIDTKRESPHPEEVPPPSTRS